ncbi:hypothetical protein SCHPADRAFT_940637 [Schizopora paradoxa]|uniref:Uncharacterized protein n=1 Tax=Schizopora paradoxa TaxID=27342 RepID=A0A0H2RNH7_9AGAM|nr:hypothetical protein SCHPADRAFT_940637 [Schizopora paradoxa]
MACSLRHPFEGVTQRQRDFILTITSALEKYESENTSTSGEVSFMTAIDLLINETVRLEYALRMVGSGGPGMERANAFRNILRTIKESHLDSNTKLFSGSLTALQAMRNLASTTNGLHNALKDFIGITFNSGLMESLQRLSNVLMKFPGLGIPDSQYSTIDIEAELTATFMSIQRYFKAFVDEDIRIIKSVQNDRTLGYVNLTVIATFLSGVTASVLQIVGPTTSGDSALAVAVNASLFSSLVFSSASAAQSLLAIIWMQSFVRLPEKTLPHILHAWLHRGPIISLLVAGALFSVGLVLFVYSSQQHPVTSVITTLFAALQTICIMSLTVLFVRARWRFRRECGIIGQKLTRSSILFVTIEWLEKWHKSVFVVPSSSSPQEDVAGHESRPPLRTCSVDIGDIRGAPSETNLPTVSSTVQMPPYPPVRPSNFRQGATSAGNASRTQTLPVRIVEPETPGLSPDVGDSEYSESPISKQSTSPLSQSTSGGARDYFAYRSPKVALQEANVEKFTRPPGEILLSPESWVTTGEINSPKLHPSARACPRLGEIETREPRR